MRSGTNGEFESKSDAEQKDAHGTAQRGATNEAGGSGGITDEKRARSKEAANAKAASEKGADENTGSSFLQKARKFFTEQVAQEGREDEPASTQWRCIARCLEFGLKEAGLSLPIRVKDRSLLEFSGANANGIVCHFEGFDSIFVPKWKYDCDKNGWCVKYVERLWHGMPQDGLSARDNAAEFAGCFNANRVFCEQDGCENFAQTFDNALKTLRGEVPVGEYYAVSFAALPQPSLRAFAAAGIADVFGAMGSWNDEPPYIA